MHAAIKKFWTKKRGYRLVGPTLIDSWEIHIPVGGPFNMFRIETVCHGDKYHYNNEWYSEAEMLKIVKMKAFA